MRSQRHRSDDTRNLIATNSHKIGVGQIDRVLARHAFATLVAYPPFPGFYLGAYSPMGAHMDATHHGPPARLRPTVAATFAMSREIVRSLPAAALSGGAFSGARL